MIINRNMDIIALQERMGGTATEQDARRFRDILCEEGLVGMDTAQVGDVLWHELLDMVDAEKEARNA